MRYTLVRRFVLALVLLASFAGCWPATDEPIPAALVPMIVAARLDPAATVRLAQDFFMQKQFAATEMLFTPKFVSALTDNGRRSYGEIQRGRADTVGYVIRYEILAVRYPDPATAHVDIDVYRGSGTPSEQTVFLTNGSQGWQINGGLSRNIVP
jgi:hypothetical protein